jgi:hypothetical protein
MTSSEDRWLHPADGADPRDLDDPDVHAERVADRQTTRDQDAERTQGLSSDKPGVDPSDREREVGGTEHT